MQKINVRFEASVTDRCNDIAALEGETVSKVARLAMEIGLQAISAAGEMDYNLDGKKIVTVTLRK